MTTLRGLRVALRPVSESDLPRLFEILRQPAVARFWTPPENEREREGLLLGSDPDGADAISTFVITLADEVVGYIAGWEILEPDYRHAGVDVFLDSARHGRGYGVEAIQLVCRWLFEVRGHHRVIIDPAADNHRAIRSYERAGFKRVGVLRRYERGADGTFHDGLLLDLLAEDLA
ncbi:MAG: N-acetyltransferase [Myxococcales bacterium]|nr:MAG: N-acetyltransferase [Myxococcales bacterium]